MICFTPRMHSRITALLMMIVLALAPAASAGGKKEAKGSITFHIETADTDNPKMIFSQMAFGKMRSFMRSPYISLADVASFAPFPSDDGQDYGLVLQLKPNAITRLAALTNANQGRWMIVQVNGRVVDGVQIDKQIDDGRMVIWKGVTLQDIAILDEGLPRTGQNGKKKD